MNITTAKMHVRTARSLPILCLVILLSACSREKDNDDNNPAPNTDQTSGGIAYFQVQRVNNLPAEVDNGSPTADVPEFLYSLEANKKQPANMAKTADWDISFSGMSGSFIGGNNNTDPKNTGYRGIGKGGIMIVDKPFEEVIDIPAEIAFKTGKGVVGTDDAGNYGQGLGWYLYDFNGTVVGDGSDNKKHVAYALGNPLRLSSGSTLAARTLIVKTGNGNYAKIKMISCYQNVIDPANMFINTPHMYYTFEYTLAPASSKKFVK